MVETANPTDSLEPSPESTSDAAASITASRSIGRLCCARWKSVAGVLCKIEPYGQGALLLVLRLLYGGMFAQTGWGKFVNFERTVGFFESLGMPFPAVNVMFAAGTELIGGVMLVLGMGARFAAAALAGVMGVAYITAHRKEGFSSIEAFTEQAPYPFLIACLVLLAFGAGRFAVDAWLRRRCSR